MNTQIRKIIVLGGGTAGWITAGIIAAEHSSTSGDGVEITLIESPSLGPIGVGEGTWPTLRNTLIRLGISETDFIRTCDASFKQASKFAGWMNGQVNDSYYHPFSLPQKYMEHNLCVSWQSYRQKIPFAKALGFQADICDRGLAPKQLVTPEYAGIANYGYHLDSLKFSEMLKTHAVSNLGVRLISDDVVGCIPHENGDIRAVSTIKSGLLEADLFIDCSGFKSILLGGHYGIPNNSTKDILFADKAIALQVPYESEVSPIASYTLSTAKRAGWIWDIGLPTRRGVGYVYSSAHSSQEDAENELTEYVSASGRASELSIRNIDINSGYKSVAWHKNCVAVGLSAGFVEPLEASSLVMVELAAKALSENFPATRQMMNHVAHKFNEVFRYRWERIIDFLKLHYVLSKRTDSDFWIDNRREVSIPLSLQGLLECWRYRSPWHCDFVHRDEIFSAASYQYVLYGMEFETLKAPNVQMMENDRLLVDVMKDVASGVNKILPSLPTNRDLLQKIKKHGFQRI